MNQARLLLRRGLAMAQRWVFPVKSGGVGTCGRCHRPWVFCERHFTKGGRFCCSPLCRACWKDLSIGDRLPYYKGELTRWIADMRAKPHIRIAPDLEQEILRAVEEGR